MGKATGELAKELGIPFWRLYDLIRRGAIREPARLGGRGGYVWMPENVEAVKAVLFEQYGTA